MREFKGFGRSRLSKMQKKTLAAFLLFLAIECGGLCFGQVASTQAEVGRISEALRNRDFEMALTLSQAALEKQPGDYRIWTLRGIALAGTGKLSAALTAYQHALKISPNYLPALEGAAQSDFQLGQDAARPLLLRVLAQLPDDSTSNEMLAVLEFRKGNCGDAVEHFERAGAAIASQSTALTEYGWCLDKLNRNEDAVKVFADVLSLDPSKPEARYNLALAQSNAHQDEEALATLQPLVDTLPGDQRALALSAEILESRGDTPHSVEMLRRAILANPKDVNVYLQFASLSFEHASPKVGIDVLNAGLTQLPNEPRLYLARGVLLTQLGEFSEAADDFERASRIDPQLSFLNVAEGLVKSQQHMSDEALAKFRAAVQAHPNDAFAQYLLAEALQELGKPEGSPEYREEVAAAMRAVKLDPNLVASHDLLSSIYLENGHTDLSIEHSRTALRLDPNDQQAVYHLILALRKAGQKDEVQALMKRLVELRASAKTIQNAGKQYRLYEEPVRPATPSH
jgi:tetratricopeptide (TPR) repeat protein